MRNSGEKLIASYSAARLNYLIHDSLEAGLVLTGTEVKSLRFQAPSLKDSFIEVNGPMKQIEAWLVHLNISPYAFGNIWNHEPMRRRKLLLQRSQLEKLWIEGTQKRFVFIPLRLYFKQGRVKLEFGICQGRKNFDKRAFLKQKAVQRDLEEETHGKFKF